MSFPPRAPRAPTSPPIEPIDLVTLTARKVEPWQKMLAALALVAGVGAGVATWKRDIATKVDLAVEHSSAQVSLVALQTAASELAARVAAHEAALELLARQSTWLTETVYQMALRDRVPVVPPPVVKGLEP